MFRLFIICLALLILSSCMAQSPKSEADPVAEDGGLLDSDGERLIASAPKNWQLIYQLNSGEVRLTDFIPPDETEKDWQTKLSFEAHTQLADIDPISIVMGEIKSKNEICSNIDHSNLFSGFENNYPTSVRLIQCGENAHLQMGEINLIKAIQGNDYFYIIRFQKKVPVFERGKAEFTNDEVATWASFLKLVTLCDTRDTNHACPSSASEAP